jgi:thioesterase domain-containing protein
MKFLVAELLGLKLKDAPRYVAEKVRELRRKIRVAAGQIQYKTQALPKGRHLDDPEQIVYLALKSYRPAPYIGRLVFFKAAEGAHGNAWDYSRGWLHLVTGEFEVYETPGDHRSMFQEPHVETLASHMMKYFG